MLLISFAHRNSEIFPHSSGIIFFKSKNDCGLRFSTAFFKSTHICSIGFKSGEYGGKSKHCMPLLYLFFQYDVYNDDNIQENMHIYFLEVDEPISIIKNTHTNEKTQNTQT